MGVMGTYKNYFQNLSWTELRFVLKILREVEFPKYTGAIFRGALCTTYRRLVCIQKGKMCYECPVKQNCSYNLLFEKPIEEGVKVSGETQAAANPFIIEPPLLLNKQVKAGDHLNLNLILIGKAIEYLPMFLFVMQKMGKTGIAPKRTPFRIERVDSIRKCGRKTQINLDQNLMEYRTPVIINGASFFKKHAACSHLAIDFITPTRIVKDSKMQTSVTFEMLMQGIFRRLNQLLVHYGNLPQPLDFRNLLTEASNIETLATDLDTLHWERFSFRQKQTIFMDGIVGSTQFQGNLTPFIPFLQIAEHLHVGKHTAFGMGKIKVRILT